MEFDLDGDGAAHVIPFLIKHNYVKERDSKVKRQLFFVITVTVPIKRPPFWTFICHFPCKEYKISN